MSATERSLLKALLDLEQAVQAMRDGGPRPNLTDWFARIDDLARDLPGDVDPTLRHYLQRKSYEKARLWLQGRDEENRAGSCRH